ncbi:MAG: MBL fold metallo-hydrolase [Clostridiales bacterium]|nr:MBL fold metallo-hydrolase [Clostridiales bacterium]
MNFIQIHLSVTNCFLIESENKYILFDTGYEEDWELFCTKLREANVELSQISHIILSHHHDDHCGLLHNILKVNKSIKVVMSKSCSELIKTDKNDQTHVGGLLNRRIAFLIRLKQFYLSIILKKKVSKKNNLTFPPYCLRNLDIIVRDGTYLRNIGIPLDGKIIETPGHTVDSISVLFQDGDCLIGDAAANFLQFAGTKYCIVFICNMDDYYKSWEKVINDGARRIFPAHGKPFSVDMLRTNLHKNKMKNLILKI